jgi:hypothetical protein
MLISCFSSHCNILGVMDVCKQMQTQAVPSVRGVGCTRSYAPSKQRNSMFHYATTETFTLHVWHGRTCH